jgi:hypothetical protein
MIGETNRLDCPEIRHYSRQVLEGVVIVTYEVRQPGERTWTLVKLFVPAEKRRRVA